MKALAMNQTRSLEFQKDDLECVQNSGLAFKRRRFPVYQGRTDVGLQAGCYQNFGVWKIP